MALKEFKKFQAMDMFQKLEKCIVETHSLIFNHFQENFLQINENLNLYTGDKEFQLILNNQLEPNPYFNQYAHTLSYQFI